MRRHLRLYGAFWRNCLRQAVEFRANLWANVFSNLIWLSSLVLLLKVIFRHTTSIAGWSETEMFLLLGTYSTVRGITDTLFSRNLSELPAQIRLGTMDFTLLRPVNSQFFVSLRYVSLDSLGQFAGALSVLAYGLSRLPSRPHFTDVLAYLYLVVCAVVLLYALGLLTMTLSFWLVRLDNLWVALEMVTSIGRTPVDVFRAWGRLPQFVLTYVLPLAFLAAAPTKALFGRLSLPALAAGGALAAFFFVLSTLFWHHATRAYASASS